VASRPHPPAASPQPPLTLQAAGEFGLIDGIARLIRGGAAPGPAIGIGDDAAGWSQPAAFLVATTDTLVEGIHFDLALTGWRDLGWKALAANLSDVAAMGAAPTWALVSLALRPDTRVDDVLDFYRGLDDLAGQAGCGVAGGDTVAAHDAQVVSIAVLGSVPEGEAHTVLRRDAGRPGDCVAVTGYLGASGAGLHALRHAGSRDALPAEAEALAEAHLRPRPQLRAGHLLRRAGVRCAMDVSDGLLADLAKLCEASAAGAVVHAGRLPLHPAAVALYPERALEWAAGGGEDYELLFAAPPAAMTLALERLAAAGIRATEIGALRERDSRRPLVDVIVAAGREIQIAHRGWDHFSSFRPAATGAPAAPDDAHAPDDAT
jgi:thiamine-monophosphate kinase